MRKTARKGKRIGVIEFAAILNCHPVSIQKFIKNKPGFPQPEKLFGKNTWDEDVAYQYREKLLSGGGKAA